MGKNKLKITKAELDEIIKRIMLEAENQARFNGTEFIGLTADEITLKVNERIGNNWEVIK